MDLDLPLPYPSTGNFFFFKYKEPWLQTLKGTNLQICDRANNDSKRQISSCWGQGSKVSYRASCCLARTYTTVGRVPGPWPLRTGYVRVFDDLVVQRVYDGKEGK